MTTEEGITKDLEAMKRVGFGGAVIYEQVFTDRPEALKSLSPEWLSRVRFAAKECARLGMSLEINSASGYVSGGPWITPELGMQRLVSSEVIVDGGHHVEMQLPSPPTVLGFYRDVAVLAYPSPAGAEDAKPVITSNVASLDTTKLVARGLNVRSMPIRPPENGQPILIQFDYGQPQTIRSISYSQRATGKALVIATQTPTSWADDAYGEDIYLIPDIGQLEASDDGQQWKKVCALPGKGGQLDTWSQQTVSFPATTARFFRLNCHGWDTGKKHDPNLYLGGVELRGEARIDHWESKSGNVVDFSDPDKTPAYQGEEVIDPGKIIDLTQDMGADGKLTWDAPPGRWTILRLGHTPTGAKTKHGRPETMGLESDMLSAAATKVQFDNYAGVILREIRQVPGAKLEGMLMDSAEQGSQNWTSDFEAQFERRRGYSLRKFLPVMMGRVIGSPGLSDKVLFDVRRTIADLVSDAYFGTFQKLCNAEGMTLMAQAPGLATCLPTDEIQARGQTDIPMGEFWMTQPEGTMDCKETASAAHVYGKPIAAAESFTGSKPDAYPAMMKPFADAALSLGINRFSVLAYLHQPDERLPGVTEDRFYLPYQRHNTWWEDSGGFWTTLARSSYMMQQGHPAIDLLYHLGNDTPLKIATWRMRPAPPKGYDYDVMGDEVLTTRTHVQDGCIVLPDGMSYRLLVLAGGDRMTLAAARQLKALVTAGATVLGPNRPIGSPSLTDGKEGNDEVRQIGEELWGSGELPAAGEKNTGAGRVVWGRSPAEVLAEIKVAPDFAVVDGSPDASLLYAHRVTDDTDIYFVANHKSAGAEITAAFRVTGRTPELWNPETGTVTPLQNWHAAGNTTRVKLALEANDSVFVVFKNEGKHPLAQQAKPQLLMSERPVLENVQGPWTVHFTPGWGAPDSVEMNSLQSWSDSSDAGIQHYSGHATYSCEFKLEKKPDSRVWLDLGNVAVIASAKLNGHPLGTAWKSPYSFDITDALQVGENKLEVEVANLWTNRLIMDAGLPEADRKTWVTWNPYKPSDPLLSSGLLGPVVIRSGKEEPAKK